MSMIHVGVVDIPTVAGKTRPYSPTATFVPHKSIHNTYSSTATLQISNG
jgi:hypothetical protein